VQRNLAEFPSVQYHAGWIPDRFGEVADKSFCFVHVDVDLYQPTLDSLRFFYPRLVARGMLVCDDYGYVNCPGAKQACDEFVAAIPEPLIHLPTGQAVIVKQSSR
jgi:O-methyltransferase